ncbi:MAG: hypothetical protein C0485_08000 [Pirellula sp.]|nr:hypothetical protein [Pirellula sp.]
MKEELIKRVFLTHEEREANYESEPTIAEFTAALILASNKLVSVRKLIIADKGRRPLIAALNRLAEAVADLEAMYARSVVSRDSGGRV